MSHTETPSEIKRTSISMEIPLLEAGRQRAKARRQSFSAYVCALIERDVRKGRTSITAPAPIKKAEVVS